MKTENQKRRAYYLLLARESYLAPWRIEFGAYTRAECADEKRGATGRFPGKYAARNLLIVKCDTDSQADCEAMLRQLNATRPTQETYRLQSAPFVHAPGLIAWAVNGARFADDAPTLANVVAETWGIPSAAARALVTGAASYELDGDSVVFSYVAPARRVVIANEITRN